MQTLYARGDANASGYDPLNFGDYDGMTGRTDGTEQGLMENVLEYASAADVDQQTRPMCSVGGVLGTPDTQGPSAPCCRVYEQEDYMGLHYDFCHYGDPLDMTDRYYQAD